MKATCNHWRFGLELLGELGKSTCTLHYFLVNVLQAPQVVESLEKTRAASGTGVWPLEFREGLVGSGQPHSGLLASKTGKLALTPIKRSSALLFGKETPNINQRPIGWTWVCRALHTLPSLAESRSRSGAPCSPTTRRYSAHTSALTTQIKWVS